MTRIPVYHHVYSSKGGYRTLRASPEIPAPTIGVLEDVSAKLYPKARSQPRFSVFPPDDIFLCTSLNVLSGVDHVGRTRSLVHNILVRREDAQDCRGFNHLQLPPALFVTPGDDLDRAIKNLSAFAELEDAPAPPPLHFDRDSFPRKSVLQILRILLGDQPTVVRSDKELAFERLVRVSGLVPAVVREPLAVVNGAYLPELADLGHPTVFLVGPEFELATAVRAGLGALEVGDNQGYNLPRAHPWDRFVVGTLTAGDPRKDLATLLAVLNRFRPLSRYTPEDFEELFLAFEAARNCFEEDGRLNIKRAPSEGLRAAGHFFQAGHPDIVFEMFLGCLQLLGARDLKTQVREFGQMISAGAETLIPYFVESGEVNGEDVFDFDV